VEFPLWINFTDFSWQEITVKDKSTQRNMVFLQVNAIYIEDDYCDDQ
jgi:hypothetical protein